MSRSSGTGIDFEEKSAVLLAWTRANARKLAIGVVAVVGLGLVGWLWRAADARKEANASRALSQAQRVFSSGNLALAQSDLQRLIQRYQGTRAELNARLLLAQVLYDQQKVDSGIAVLREVRSPGPFAESYHAVLAAGLEQAGRPAEAAREYLKAAEAARSSQDRATLKADAARAYRAADSLEAARRIWSELASDDANPLAPEAKVRLGELSARPVSKG